jgi:hypothetical protein
LGRIALVGSQQNMSAPPLAQFLKCWIIARVRQSEEIAVQDLLSRVIVFRARAFHMFSLAAFIAKPVGYVEQLRRRLAARDIYFKVSGRSVIEDC